MRFSRTIARFTTHLVVAALSGIGAAARGPASEEARSLETRDAQGGRSLQEDRSEPRIEELAPSGAWCWFQDPRAVYHEGKHRRTYVGWITLQGDVQVASVDLDTGETITSTLHEKLERDDHDNPVLLITSDGRITAFYSRHNGKSLFYRESAEPESIASWGPERTIGTNTRPKAEEKLPYLGYTYAHPVQLSAEHGRIYLFWRGGDWKPAFSTTVDGQTWANARTLIASDERRPYLKVASNGRDAIHFAYTTGDPNPAETRETSLYHAYYKGGFLHRTDGTRLCSLDDVPFDVRQGSNVWDHRATGHRAWVWDVALEKEGTPVIVFATFPNRETDHRYQYARWDGKKWNVSEITDSPGGFTLPLDDGTRKSPCYSGGVALDHADPSKVYLSSKRNGVFEIEKWSTVDGGATWSSESITSGSKKNNVRPVVPWGFNGKGVEVLWMYGDYYWWKAGYHTGIRMRIAR